MKQSGEGNTPCGGCERTGRDCGAQEQGGVSRDLASTRIRFIQEPGGAAEAQEQRGDSDGVSLGIGLGLKHGCGVPAEGSTRTGRGLETKPGCGVRAKGSTRTGRGSEIQQGCGVQVVVSPGTGGRGCTKTGRGFFGSGSEFWHGCSVRAGSKGWAYKHGVGQLRGGPVTGSSEEA